MFYTEEEMMIFSEYPEKSKEELIPILEFSIEQAKAEGDVYVPEVCGSVLRKIRQELADEGYNKGTV